MALTKPKKETKPKKPTTLAEYQAQGWKVGPIMKMSDPPVYTLTKDGKTIQFRPPMKKNPFGNRPKTPREEKPSRKLPKNLKGLGKRAAEALREKFGKQAPINKKAGGLAGRLAKRGYGKAMR
jgi:uncharacterized phage-associated protein